MNKKGSVHLPTRNVSFYSALNYNIKINAFSYITKVDTLTRIPDTPHKIDNNVRFTGLAKLCPPEHKERVVN